MHTFNLGLMANLENLVLKQAGNNLFRLLCKQRFQLPFKPFDDTAYFSRE
jgi:hypothetical protein